MTEGRSQPQLTDRERAAITEAMRAFPFLPACITVPLGLRYLGPVVVKARR